MRKIIPIGTIVKLAGLLVATLLVMGALLLAGFGVAASVRQTLPAGIGPGEGARHVTVGDIRLHYRQWGPDDGPPILLVHGTLAWAETWRDIAIPLAQAGYRVIAPDLPPFGYSQRPADGNYSRQAQAALLVGFAEAMRLDGFVLAGHSFGGGATLEAALAMRDDMRALLLLDVALGFETSRPAPLVGLLLRLPANRMAVAAASFANPLVTGIGLRSFVHDTKVVTEDRLALYRAPLTVEGTASAIGDWMRTGLFADHSTARSMSREILAGLDIPTLVIWGREDTVTPLAQGKDIAGLLPDARLVVLDGVNHIPHLERPELVVEAIQAFLPPMGLRPGG